jgi:signal transduction histidine kinase
MLSSPLVPAPRPRDNASPAAPHDHTVQFYDSDEFLAERVADFVRDGLRNAETVILVATPEHRDLFCARLAAEGIDVAQERSLGHFTLLDASETLGTFMVGGMPDWELFNERMGSVIERCSRTGKGIRAYGEMVDLLWRSGQTQAALKLEELWNALAQTHSFSLLCGYVMNNFFRETDAGRFESVCSAHSHVRPTEAYRLHTDSDTALREIAVLQQRARALESEVARREQLEEGLRDALAERSLVEDELRASRKELERQNEELSRTVRFSEMFVGILGHDLRNPLSAIVTAASLLTRRAEVDQVARPARRILSSAGRMARMIDQLLDFTRIRLGHGLPIQAHAIDLAHLCQVTLDELSAERHRVELSASGDPVGQWDGDRLAQLVSNLVSNALTHGGPDGGVRVRIDGSEPANVRLEVHNSGAIPESLLPGIFEPLHSSNDRKYEGSSGLGLGLYITRQIVQAHSGSIEVTSSEADGTCFIVDLPRCPAAR